VARDDDRQRISTVRRADGTHRPGMTDLLGNLRIRPGLAERDRPQRVPHVALEGGARWIQRHGKALAASREVLRELALGFDEQRVRGVFARDVQSDSAWAIVLPEDCREAPVGRD